MFKKPDMSHMEKRLKHKPEYKLSPKSWYLKEQSNMPHINAKNSNVMRERVSVRALVTINEEYIQKTATEKKTRLKPASQCALMSEHIGEEMRYGQRQSLAQRTSGYRFKAGRPGLTANSGVSAYADKERSRKRGKQKRQFTLIVGVGFVIITAVIIMMMLPGGETLAANKNQAVSTPYADAADALAIPAPKPTPAPVSETADTITP